METKDILLELRSRHELSQEALAEKLHVTRQAVSRWENGETVPNIDTLKVLSKLYDVSINTLLGSPRQLICQCCGMLLEDGTMSREPDGSLNENYCKWCYADATLPMTASTSSSIFSQTTWLVTLGRQKKSVLISKSYCQSLNIGNEKRSGTFVRNVA